MTFDKPVADCFFFLLSRAYLSSLLWLCAGFRGALRLLQRQAILVGLKEQDDKRECARLQQEFTSLRSVFVSEVCACVVVVACASSCFASL